MWRSRDSFTQHLETEKGQNIEYLSSAGSLKRSTDDGRGQGSSSSVAKKGSWLCRVQVFSLLVIGGEYIVHTPGRGATKQMLHKYTHTQTQQLPPPV